MTQRDLFLMLGAPLANARWSWGSVRSDGIVFLRVWEDRIRQYDGSSYVQITHLHKFRRDPKLGHQERLRHVELLKQGARCYMVMCRALDVDSSPRKVKSFNEDQVFPGGKIVSLDGDSWIELLPAVPIGEVALLRLPEEVPSGSAYTEGSVERILVNRYERDRCAREVCIKHYGTKCFLCGFDFVAVYGKVMVGFTHVHHLKPLSSVGADYKVVPISDLRPVCPNCHAVLHRREPAYSLDAVRQFLQARIGQRRTARKG